MEVKIELGHKAWKNIKPTKEGYTHDFTLFVQGVNGNEIKHIVDKVVFQLPDTYPNPNRIMDKPPYVLSESTSRSLSIDIDVFFCAESTLKKVHYIYDIFISDEEVNTSWERKLSFPNPSKELKKKLLLAGGEQVDLLEAFPVINGEIIKIKEEPIDETEIVNNSDKAASNTIVQNTDNLLNEGSTISELSRNEGSKCSEEQLSLSKLLDENNNLKKANIEIKEKVNRQEKLMAYYEEHFSRYEENILNANVGIDKLKKKIEADEKEVINLRLQLQMLQVKSKLLKIQNTSDHPVKRTKGTKRKNEVDLNTSAVVGKEKENVIQSPPKLISSFTQKSPPFKNAFASIENQNASETVKSNSAISSIRSAAGNKTALIVSGVGNTPPGNSVPSNSNYEIPSQSGNLPNQKNFDRNQDIGTLDSSKDASFANTSSDKSKSICDIEKSMEENSNKDNGSLNNPNAKNKTIEKPVNPSPVSVNSFPNSPDIIIIDEEKFVKRKTPEIITIDAEGSSAESNGSLNSPEIITICDEESTKGNLVNDNVSLNKPHTRNNEIEKLVGESSAEVNSMNAPESTVNAAISEKISTNAYTFVNTDLRNNAEKTADGKSLEASTSVSKLCLEPHSVSTTQKQLGTPVQENNISSTQRTNVSSNSQKTIVTSKIQGNRKRKKKRKGIQRKILDKLQSKKKSHISTNKKLVQHSSFDKISGINSSIPSCTEKSEISNEQAARGGVLHSERLRVKSVCKEFYEALGDISAPKFTSFLTEHCLKLKTELDRLKNSEFGRFRESANPLFSKLLNIDAFQISDQCFFQYVKSLINYFSNPESLDLPTLIYVIVDFLYRDRIPPESLSKYFQNQDICVHLLPSENCIVHALFEVERISVPHLNGLIRTTLNIIHQVLISKKNMPPYGLASLCRVFMEICKCRQNRWEPLFLCCELLKLGHPLASYLINSLASVWRAPFTLQNNFSVDENMLLGAIHYGMQEKPFLMNCDLWRLTLRLKSTYFPRPFMVNPQHAIQFLTNEVVSRCIGGSFLNIWMLSSPLVIFVSKETWEWKMGFKNEYLIPKLLQFSRSSNEKAFGLFCNLYLDIFSFGPKSPDEQVVQYFTDADFHLGVDFVQDWAAVALIKYIGTTDKHMPAPLRDWFLKNQDNPKLATLINLYCRKVMESNDSILKWEDIIIALNIH